MRIGIDIRPLQGHHRVRGIGMHIKALVKWLLINYVSPENKLVFYVYKELPNPIDDFHTPNDNYEMVYLSDFRNTLPFLPTIVTASIAYLRRVLTPIPSKLAKKSDVFLAFDFMLGMPRKKDVNYVIIGYDLIQILYARHYLPGFWDSKRSLGFRQAAFSSLVARLYKKALKRVQQNDTKILAISDNSRQQFIELADIKPGSIRTVYLGNPIEKTQFTPNDDDLSRVKELSDKKFILFIGGADWRRKIDDLVAAYNLLKAKGHDIRLVLAGFDFASIDSISVPSSKNAIINSSYRRDIELLGYINDSEKKYLYENAISFVYPSICEGFGIPILEAVQEHCPVVAYDGHLSSMGEVAGKNGAIIVEPSHIGIYTALEGIIGMNANERHDFVSRASESIERFSWDKCARETLAALEDKKFLN